MFEAKSYLTKVLNSEYFRKEFPVPEAGKLLFLWSIVSLSVIGVFLLILVSIWKMDIFRDYRRMYWKNSSDDEKQICKPSDMSMYPPVHQIVPTLFPNELSASNNTTNALPFGMSLTLSTVCLFVTLCVCVCARTMR